MPPTALVPLLKAVNRSPPSARKFSVPTRTVSVSPMATLLSFIEPGTTREPCGCVASQV